MKKINLNKETANLQLSVDELVALRKILIEVYHRIGEYGFETRVNISREEAIKLVNDIGQTIELLTSKQVE